jgi:hypothetical protein
MQKAKDMWVEKLFVVFGIQLLPCRPRMLKSKQERKKLAFCPFDKNTFARELRTLLAEHVV